MQAEVYIRARKVFVADKVENTEKCPQCEERGQTYLLRYFYLSLEEAIYKCGNSQCLYPNHHFVFKNLKDKTVYYYQEVEDGTNDVMLKVSMDGQNKYKSANPMQTELFSESQRNPDIESYDFDLLDFLADNNASAPSTGTSSNAVAKLNDDYLDFLDEMPDTSLNANESNLDKSGVDSFIDDLLNSTASPISGTWPNQQKKTEKVTLSKCMKHLEKVNERKKVKKDKPQETFLQKVRKTKEAQSTGKRKQTAAGKVNTIVSSAQNLRPTQFVNQLKSLDLKYPESCLIRNLVKIKEDNKNGASSNKDVEVKNEPIDTPSIVEPTQLVQRKRKRPKKKEKNDAMVEKKESKPRKTPVRRQAKVAAAATAVKTKPVGSELAESVVEKENKCVVKPLDRVPITIDLSRISVPEVDGKKMSKNIQIKGISKIASKRSRKKKTEVELPKPKKIKKEQLDESTLTESAMTRNTQNAIPIGNPLAAAVSSITNGGSQFETEKTDANEPGQSNSKSDEEDPLMAFQPVTESDLSRNHLNDFETLKLIPNSTTPESTPVKRPPPHKRRSTVSAKKSNTNRIDDVSGTQSEKGPSPVPDGNAEQKLRPKRATRNQNNNNTQAVTIESEEIEMESYYQAVIEVTDNSDASDSSRHRVTDGTSKNSNDTTTHESKPNRNTQMEEDFESKMNVTNYYRPKKFERKTEKVISINEIIEDWESASEGGRSCSGNRLSCDSDITFTQTKDLLMESDRESIISLTSSNTGGDTRTENTESEP